MQKPLKHKLLIALGTLLLGVFSAGLIRYVVTPPKSIFHAGTTALDFIALGDEVFLTKQYSQALAYYEQAVRKDNKNAAARLRIGQLYQLKNRYSEAEQELKFALVLDPDNPEILYRLGSIYLDLRYFEEAQKYFERLVEVLANDDDKLLAKAHAKLATAYLWQEEYFLAHENFTTAFSLQSDDVYSRLHKALTLSLSDPRAAEKELQQTQILFPSHILTPKVEVALQSVQDALNSSNRIEERIKLGKTYLQHELPSLSRPLFQEIVNQNPDVVEGHLYLGYAYFLLGEISYAQTSLATAVSLQTGPQQLAHFYLGEIALYQEEYPLAVQEYERAISLGAQQFETYYHLGLALRNIGEYSKASRAFERALEKNPEHESARTSSIFLHLQFLKDQEAAKKIALKGIESSPSNARFHDLLGWVELEMHNFASAEEQFLTAIGMDENLASAYFNLASLYEKQNNTSRALDYYQLALDIDTQGDIAPLADAALSRLHGDVI